MLSYVINDRPLCRLEHSGRIIWSSNLLGEYLIKAQYIENRNIKIKDRVG